MAAARVTVIPMETPEAATLPEVIDFVMKAVSPLFLDGKAILRWISEQLPSEHLGVFFVSEAGQLTGFAMMTDESNPFVQYPRVLYLYARGAHEARNALADAIMGWAEERGHDRVWALNQSALNDDQYLRAFGQVVEGKKVSSVIEFHRKGGGDGR